MLPKERRLRSSREFETVYRRGKAFTDRLVVLRMLRRDVQQSSRFGFSTSPKLGSAVVRNRAKRRLREAVRLMLGEVRPAGFDAILIARPAMGDASFEEIRSSVGELLRRAGALTGPCVT